MLSIIKSLFCLHQFELDSKRHATYDKDRKRLVIYKNRVCCKCGKEKLMTIDKQLLVVDFNDILAVLNECNTRNEILRVSNYIDYTIEAYNGQQARLLFTIITQRLNLLRNE